MSFPGPIRKQNIESIGTLSGKSLSSPYFYSLDALEAASADSLDLYSLPFFVGWGRYHLPCRAVPRIKALGRILERMS